VTNYSGKATGAGGRGFSAEIRVEGLAETIAALRLVEPEALKVLKSTMRKAGLRVAANAHGRFAATGHPGGVYKVEQKLSSRTKPGLRVFATDYNAAVFEFAGTRMAAKGGKGPITPQGAAMVAWLQHFAKPGRFLWGAWDAQAPVFEAELKSAMATAEQGLQAKLDAVGGL
jgi:hypothetical protein